jgi:hypothetical protein
MEMTRSTWTDSRLDDMATNVDRRFDELARLIKEGFERNDADMREIRGELHALQRGIIQVGGGLIAAQTGLIAAVLLAGL